SEMPTNLLTVEASMLSAPPPSNDDRRLVPLSAACADPARPPAMLPSMSVGCAATAFASCWTPPGRPTTPANPLKIDGTAAPSAVCAVDGFRPHAEANLLTTSGVNKLDIADKMLLVMGNPLMYLEALKPTASLGLARDLPLRNRQGSGGKIGSPNRG